VKREMLASAIMTEGEKTEGEAAPVGARDPVVGPEPATGLEGEEEFPSELGLLP
jgi:hypothetical protein